MLGGSGEGKAPIPGRSRALLGFALSMSCVYECWAPRDHAMSSIDPTYRFPQGGAEWFCLLESRILHPTALVRLQVLECEALPIAAVCMHWLPANNTRQLGRLLRLDEFAFIVPRAGDFEPGQQWRSALVRFQLSGRSLHGAVACRVEIWAVAYIVCPGTNIAYFNINNQFSSLLINCIHVY